MKNNVLTVFLYGKIWPESRYKATFCHSALTLWRSHFIRWNIPCMPSPSPSIFRHRAIVQTNRVQLSGRCNWRSRQKLLICNVWRRSMEAFTCIRCYFYSRLQEPVHCWQTRNVNWGKWQVGFSESVSETCRIEWRKKSRLYYFASRNSSENIQTKGRESIHWRIPYQSDFWIHSGTTK